MFAGIPCLLLFQLSPALIQVAKEPSYILTLTLIVLDLNLNGHILTPFSAAQIRLKQELQLLIQVQLNVRLMLQLLQYSQLLWMFAEILCLLLCLLSPVLTQAVKEL